MDKIPTAQEYAKNFDIDQKRLEIITGRPGAVLAELVSVMKEVEDLSWQMLEIISAN